MNQENIQKIKEFRKQKLTFRQIATILNISHSNAQYHSGESNTKEKSLSSQRNRRRSFKKELINFHGGKCQICGYNKSKSALDFHHLDPSKKSFSISNKIREGTKKEIFQQCIEESKKCILVCSNCHHEIHDGLVGDTGLAPVSKA